MDKISKYKIVFEDILSKILDNKFTDNKLPPVKQIAKDYDISLMTAHKVVQLLSQEGVVDCGQGRNGTVLNSENIKISQAKRNAKLNTWHNLSFFSKREITLNCCSSISGAFCEELRKELIEDFQKKYPWITVNFTVVENFDRNDLDSYDVFQCNYSLLINLINANKIFDISQYGYGKYSIKLLENIPLIFYDKNVIPDAPKTSDEFIKINNELQKNGHFSSLQVGLFTLLHHFSGNIKSLYPENLKKSLNLLKFYYNWETPWNNLDSDEIREAIEQKNISMLVTYINNAISLLPNDNWQMASFAFSDGLILSEGLETGVLQSSKYKGDALLWCKYLSSYEAQKIIVKYNVGIPQNVKVFDEDFKQMRPKLHDFVKKNKDKFQSPYVSENLRNSMYMKYYYLLEDFCKGEISEDEISNLFIENINELLLIEDIL